MNKFSLEIITSWIIILYLEVIYLIWQSLFPGANLLTHWGWDKMAAILQKTFSNAFFQGKSVYFVFSNEQYPNTGSDNGLAPARWQAIIWTNDGLVYWCIYASLNLNVLRPEQKGHAFADAISKLIFFNENYCIMIQIPLKSFFFRVSLTTIRHHWVRQWLGVKLATSHYLNQWWPSLLTHICVTQPKC